jgi:hypothetical protein
LGWWELAIGDLESVIKNRTEKEKRTKARSKDPPLHEEIEDEKEEAEE